MYTTDIDDDDGEGDEDAGNRNTIVLVRTAWLHHLDPIISNTCYYIQVQMALHSHHDKTASTPLPTTIKKNEANDNNDNRNYCDYNSDCPIVPRLIPDCSLCSRAFQNKK